MLEREDLPDLAVVTPSHPVPCFQYLQLKEKLEHEFPGCLNIVSLGMHGESHGPLSVPWGWEAVGMAWAYLFTPRDVAEKVSQKGHLRPL